MINSYFLSIACAETLEVGIIEFDTYSEAFASLQQHELSGYSVALRAEAFCGALAAELRKAEGYVDRRDA